MFIARHTIRRAALWLTMALLLSQWAIASYACPRAAADGAAAVTMPDMPGCDGTMPRAAMDPDQPQLCKAHCESPSQSAQPPVSYEPSPSYSLWAVLDWHAVVLQTEHGMVGASLAASSPPPAGAPPIYLSFRVLRN
jgi:hypothetical protein